jgi:hypothetical protein
MGGNPGEQSFRELGCSLWLHALHNQGEEIPERVAETMLHLKAKAFKCWSLRWFGQPLSKPVGHGRFVIQND